jgi:AcrR family transcriptional regulator
MSKPDKPRDLREDCVREALTIIADKGLEALSMRDVARRLGVSHQAPYKHFESRDHVLAEIVATAFGEFAAHLDGRTRSDDAFEDLGNMGLAYLAFAEQQPLKYRLMFGSPLPDPEAHPEMIRRGQHAFSLLEEAIARVHRSEGRNPVREEVELDAMFVWSTVHGMATLRQLEPQRKLELCARTNTRMIAHALESIGRALRNREQHRQL